jgi:hypothetical protein
LVPLFLEDRPSLLVHLMRRSEALGGGLDLRCPAYPHIHRQPRDGVWGELVQVDIEVPKYVDDGGV